MLSTLAVANYQSLRQLVVPLTDLNVVSGENGSGKSNVSRVSFSTVDQRTGIK